MIEKSSSNGIEDFKKIQRVFTGHMRDPEKNPPPEGIEDRRLAIYRNLIYDNIEGFIANSFPVLRKIIPDDRWHEMLRDYVCNHQSHTPLFPRMPQEFLAYLENERQAQPEDPPFMLELAYYEWAEIAISLDVREVELDKIDTEGDLLRGVPVLNPIILPHVYQYPVHLIGPDFTPEKPPEVPTYLVVYRRLDDEVRFLELNSVSARLIEWFQQNTDKTGLQLLEHIANELDHPKPEIVIRGGVKIMQDMYRKNILLGIKKSMRH